MWGLVVFVVLFIIVRIVAEAAVFQLIQWKSCLHLKTNRAPGEGLLRRNRHVGRDLSEQCLPNKLLHFAFQRTDGCLGSRSQGSWEKQDRNSASKRLSRWRGMLCWVLLQVQSCLALLWTHNTSFQGCERCLCLKWEISGWESLTLLLGFEWMVTYIHTQHPYGRN